MTSPAPERPNGSVVVVGSLNADLVVYCERSPRPGETVRGSSFIVSPGGKSANQAVAAARLGAEVVLVGAVGDDPYAAMLLDSVRDAGVDVSRIRQRTDQPTGVALITVDAAAENSIVIVPGANGTLGEKDLDDDLFEGAAVLCLCLEVNLEVVLAAARAAHTAGAAVVFNLSPSAQVPDELLSLTDVLLVNIHEAQQLLDVDLPAEATDEHQSEWGAAAEQFAGLGLGQVVVTLGAAGAVVLDTTGPGHPRVTAIAPTPVTPVDTTGAGDGFTGALAARLANGDDLVASATFASVAAALATTGKGAQAAYPSRPQVGALLGPATQTEP